MPRHDRGSGFRGGRQTTQKSWQNGSINFSFPPPRRPTSHLLRSLLPGTSRLTKELSSAPLSSRAPHPQLRGARYGIGGGTPARGAGRSGAACPGCAPHAGSGSLPAAAPPREGRGPHLPPAAPALPPPQPPQGRDSAAAGRPRPHTRGPRQPHGSLRCRRVRGRRRKGEGGSSEGEGGGRGPAGSRPSDLPHLCLSRLPGRHPEVGQKGGGERGRPPAVPPEPGLGGAGARGTVCKPLPPQLLLGQPPWNAPSPAASPAPRLAPARPLLAGRGGVGRCSGPLGRSRGVSRRGGVGTAAFVWQRWRYAARPGGTGAECGPGRGRRRFAHVNPAIGRGSLILCSLWVLQR